MAYLTSVMTEFTVWYCVAVVVDGAWVTVQYYGRSLSGKS